MTKNISQRDKVILILAILVMLVALIGSIYFPFPSRQSMDILGFVKLWLRELLILGVILIAIIYAGARWLWQRFTLPKTEEQNEL